MGKVDFYAIAAQVIPLIFVAIAFEGRSVWKVEYWRGYAISREAMVVIRAFFMMATTFSLVVGEASALWALGSNAPVRFDPGFPAWLVAISLFVGGTALIGQVVAQIMLEYRDGKDPSPDTLGHRRLLRSVLATSVVFGAAFSGYVAWIIVSSLSR